MRVRLGIWHDQVAVYFRDRPPVGYAVELLPAAREVRLLPGNHYACLNHDGAEDDMEFPWKLTDHGCDRGGFSRCCLMEVDLREAANGWRGDLPENYDMPWPRARDCESYLRAEELMRECIVRRDSAKAHGVIPPAPPAHVQILMTPAMRVALFT